ncbi:MAG TPA: hypothetical protein DCQ06_13935 [Myxococcales bacterium]|nr:hypothetical protein [Myxococcales bacterium]
MRVCPKCGLKTDAHVCPNDGVTTVTVTDGVSTYAPGTIIAERYEVQEVLGIGGFGAVYRCNQLSMDKQVAVKVLKKEHIRSDEHVKRFAFEAQIASKLTHPNTIQIFDFGANTVDSALYLVMEFLEGETLATRLDRKRRISPQEVIHILKPVCHSLAEAHDKDLIHRDLKPENLMLTEVKGDPNYVKVLDFGIAARLAESTEQQEKLTEVGMIMGTPTYMSPEQAHGKPLDARSDIYALGVLMYEMLTGEVPFDGDQPMNVLLKHISEAPIPPCEMAPDVEIPFALEKLVLQCLEKEPMLRPQTCTELAEALIQVQTQPDGVLRRGRVNSQPDDFQVTEPVEGLLQQSLDAGQGSLAPKRRPSAHGGFVSNSSSAGSGSIWKGMGLLLLVGLIAVVLTLALVPSSKQEVKDPNTQRTPAKVQVPSSVEPNAPVKAQLKDKDPTQDEPDSASQDSTPLESKPKAALAPKLPAQAKASPKAKKAPVKRPEAPTKPVKVVKPPRLAPPSKKSPPSSPEPKTTPQPRKAPDKKPPVRKKGPTRDDFRID